MSKENLETTQEVTSVPTVIESTNQEVEVNDVIFESAEQEITATTEEVLDVVLDEVSPTFDEVTGQPA